MDNKSSTSSRSPDNVKGQPVTKKTRLVHKTIIYDESKRDAPNTSRVHRSHK